MNCRLSCNASILQNIAKAAENRPKNEHITCVVAAPPSPTDGPPPSRKMKHKFIVEEVKPSPFLIDIVELDEYGPK